MLRRPRVVHKLHYLTGRIPVVFYQREGGLDYLVLEPGCLLWVAHLVPLTSGTPLGPTGM